MSHDQANARDELMDFNPTSFLLTVPLPMLPLLLILFLSDADQICGLCLHPQIALHAMNILFLFKYKYAPFQELFIWKMGFLGFSPKTLQTVESELVATQAWQMALVKWVRKQEILIWTLKAERKLLRHMFSDHWLNRLGEKGIKAMTFFDLSTSNTWVLHQMW